MAQVIERTVHKEVEIALERITLHGAWSQARHSAGVVVFAHGSGSSRRSPRNRFVAEQLHSFHLSTLLFDLLTAEEERIDLYTAELRFDIPRLAERLAQTTDWLLRHPMGEGAAIGYFGASTGAAAALMAAAERSQAIQAVVSRGGRPDLAANLETVKAPTLLIVGGHDFPVIPLNQSALDQLRCQKRLEIVPNATHLFEEPGALGRVAELAGAWFASHFPSL